MSKIKDFRKELLQELKKRGYEASEVFSLKNNGRKDGIVFLNKSTFSPVMELQSLYEAYELGLPIGKIAGKVIEQLPEVLAEERHLQEIPVLDIFHHYPAMRKDLRICLLNRRTNEELLAVTPNKIYGEFAAVVYWMLPDDSFQIMIRQELLQKMQLDFEVVFKDAYLNMMGEFELKSMEEMLYEVITDQLRKEETKDIPADALIRKMCQGSDMYVMTHRSGTFGPAALCYQREMNQAAQKLGGDFVVIPASVDELIFLPFKRNIPLEAVNELVRRINEMQPDEDRLGDRSYVYREKEKCLISSNEYMEDTQRQMEHTQEQHQRSEHMASDEWRNR